MSDYFPISVDLIGIFSEYAPRQHRPLARAGPHPGGEQAGDLPHGLPAGSTGDAAMHTILRYTINGAKFRRIYTDQRAALVRADVLRASGVEVAIATKAKA